MKEPTVAASQEPQWGLIMETIHETFEPKFTLFIRNTDMEYGAQTVGMVKQ